MSNTLRETKAQRKVGYNFKKMVKELSDPALKYLNDVVQKEKSERVFGEGDE